MSHKLSIIMPCYNCTATLEEAVASIYTQKLQIPYEVVMVDDGSTDGTPQLITALATKYPHIRYVFHEKNKGGGAARNTAIGHSEGDLIFCLDSDDILTAGMLAKMIDLLIAKGCDGVGISTSVKFRKRNVKDVVYVTNFGYVGQRVPFESVWDSSLCSLFSTFLHTKEAHRIAGGYPTDHGFDTQGFAFRFLVNGLVAYTCPDTVYLHRTNFHRSYYIREFEAGKFSYNMFKILEEILFLFNDQVKDEILHFDIYHADPHKITINEVIHRNQNNLYVENYTALFQPNVFERRRLRLIERLNECDKYDLYWLGVAEQKRGEFERSADYFSKAILAGLDSVHAHRNLLQSLCKAAGSDYSNVLLQISDESFLQTRIVPSYPFRIRRKLRQWLSKARMGSGLV